MIMIAQPVSAMFDLSIELDDLGQGIPLSQAAASHLKLANCDFRLGHSERAAAIKIEIRQALNNFGNDEYSETNTRC